MLGTDDRFRNVHVLWSNPVKSESASNLNASKVGFVEIESIFLFFLEKRTFDPTFCFGLFSWESDKEVIAADRIDRTVRHSTQND